MSADDADVARRLLERAACDVVAAIDAAGVADPVAQGHHARDVLDAMRVLAARLGVHPNTGALVER